MNTHTHKHASYNLIVHDSLMIQTSPIIIHIISITSSKPRRGTAMKPRIPRSINKRRLGDAIGGTAVSPAMGAKTTQQQLRRKMRSLQRNADPWELIEFTYMKTIKIK